MSRIFVRNVEAKILQQLDSFFMCIANLRTNLPKNQRIALDVQEKDRFVATDVFSQNVYYCP